MKKKIVLIAEPLEKGIGRHIIDLYENFKTMDNFELTVLYGTKRISDQNLEILKQGNNYEIKNFVPNIGLKDIKAFFEIRKVLKQIKPDVVHCHGSKAGLEGRIAAKTLGIKKIFYSPHAYFFLKYEKNSLKRKIFILAEKFLSRFFTTKTITTSQGEDIIFEENNIDIPTKKVLIEHGIKVMQVTEKQVVQERQKYQVAENEILVGAMARMEEQKNPLGTIEIMDSLLKQTTNVKCIFWGNGSLLEMAKEKCKELDSRVILAGETDNPDISLSALDVYLTASLYEGLPYTLLESLALGLPIVASNVEGNKDCVCENINGYLFESKNYSQAVEKLKKMLDNKVRKQMGKESFKIYQERFSVSKMIENYEKLYLN